MKLIVGLGNPGEKYKKTRHNLGFIVVERFFKDYEVSSKTVWNNESKFKSDIAKLDWQPKVGKLEEVMLAKPKTYMNNSGMAVSLIANYLKIKPEDIWVIHDDIDLPIGSIKIRLGGASAGNKGVESIIAALHTDKFWRFRLGIGHPGKIQSFGKTRAFGSEDQAQEDKSSKFPPAEAWHWRAGKMQNSKGVEDYVLGTFAGQEWGKVKELLKRGSKAIQMGLEEGLFASMNRFNTK